MWNHSLIIQSVFAFVKISQILWFPALHRFEEFVDVGDKVLLNIAGLRLKSVINVSNLPATYLWFGKKLKTTLPKFFSVKINPEKLHLQKQNVLALASKNIFDIFGQFLNFTFLKKFVFVLKWQHFWKMLKAFVDIWTWEGRCDFEIIL